MRVKILSIGSEEWGSWMILRTKVFVQRLIILAECHAKEGGALVFDSKAYSKRMMGKDVECVSRGSVAKRFAALMLLHLLFLLGMEGSEMKDFRWENRLVLAEIGDGQDWGQWEAALSARRSEIDDRKLRFFFLTESGVKVFPESGENEGAERFADDIRLILGDKQFALIGLDGGVKARFTDDDFSLDEVFARIDRMPMRRAELGR